MDNNEPKECMNRRRAIATVLRAIDTVAVARRGIEGLDLPILDLPMAKVMLAIAGGEGALMSDLIESAEQMRRSLLVLRDRADGSVSIDAVVDIGSGFFAMAGLSLCRLRNGSLLAVSAEQGACFSIEAMRVRLVSCVPASAIEIEEGRQRAFAAITSIDIREVA